jgi:hypothetical protein
MQTVKLKAPKDAAQVSFKGKVYEVAKGIVEVPAEAVATLLSHGYAALKQDAEKAEK